jgi:6-pyruvoyltetrahydropterin/6-carboxytetrahydropterin synthase
MPEGFTVSCSISRTVAERYHDISCGHRVYGHESKCAHLHGHNYRVHFTVEAPELDHVGRVMDFSVIKSHLCMWLEDNWDHKFLIWENDPDALTLQRIDPEGVVIVPFNPTAENMAKYLVDDVGIRQLTATGCRLVKVRIEETAKCSASFMRGEEVRI